MKRFLSVFFLALVITPIANAGVIQGQFYCKEVFPDGSTDENIVEVVGKKLIMKNLVISSLVSEYSQIHINQDKGYSVFADDRRVYFLAPTTDKNKLRINGYDTQAYYEKTKITHGICRRY